MAANIDLEDEVFCHYGKRNYDSVHILWSWFHLRTYDYILKLVTHALYAPPVKMNLNSPHFGTQVGIGIAV